VKPPPPPGDPGASGIPARADPVSVAGAFGRGVAIAVVVAAVGQLPGVIARMLGGHTPWRTTFGLGWLDTLAMHRIGIQGRGPGGAGAIRLSMGFLLGTAVVLWLGYRSGRRLSRDAVGSSRAIAGSVVLAIALAVGYTVPIAVVSALVRVRAGSIPPFVPASLAFGAVGWQAVLFPFALAAGSTLAGAIDLGASENIHDGDGRTDVRAALHGGWSAFVATIVLALVGVLVVAAVRPTGLERYARAVAASGPSGAALVLGVHAMVLPNQSLMIASASMGGCVTLSGRWGDEAILCADRFPATDPPTVALDAISLVAGGSAPSGRTRPMPPGYLAFGLVPLAGTLWGGRRAAAGARDPGRRLLRAAGAGVVFAVLMAAGVWAASMSIELGELAGGPASVTLGSAPLATGLLAVGWGVLGGMVGVSVPAGQGVGGSPPGARSSGAVPAPSPEPARGSAVGPSTPSDPAVTSREDRSVPPTEPAPAADGSGPPAPEPDAAVPGAAVSADEEPPKPTSA
jgi:hypothetical protein